MRLGLTLVIIFLVNSVDAQPISDVPSASAEGEETGVFGKELGVLAPKRNVQVRRIVRPFEAYNCKRRMKDPEQDLSTS